MAKAALSGVKKLRRQAETKYTDTTISAQNIVQRNNNVTPTWLSKTIRGENPQGERDGDKITPTSMFFRYTIRRALATASEFDVVRVTVFRDKETNGALPLWQELYANVSVISPLNRLNGQRFKVLFDKVHTLALVGPSILSRKKYMRLSTTTTYIANAATIADAGDNHYFYFITTNVAANFPVVDLKCRINYKDT